MRVYIAGKISGLQEDAYRKKFADAAECIKNDGHFPINPVDTSHFLLRYDIQMQVCKLLLSTCDAIYLLDDWHDSKGAIVEKQWAEEMGLAISFQRG